MWNPTAGKIVLRNLLYQKTELPRPNPRTQLSTYLRAHSSNPPCSTCRAPCAPETDARSLGIGCTITNPAAPACCCTPSSVASAARCLTVTPTATHPEFTSPPSLALVAPAPLASAHYWGAVWHGDHRSACSRSGALRARAGAFEQAASRVCREAGVRDLNLPVPPLRSALGGGRARLPIHGGTQLHRP